MRAWCFYDCANSAFATTVTAAVLPPYFADVAAATVPRHVATATWAYGSAAALLLAAIAGPLLGATADRLGRRKRLLLGCVAVGAVATAAIAATPAGDWRAMIALFGVAFIAFACGNVLYDSLLPAVADPGELHRVSARGFAYGYLGGGILLAINLAWILFPRSFGLSGADAAIRLSFVSVALWWLGFSIPLARSLHEPRSPGVALPAHRLARDVLVGLGRTLGGLRRRPELLQFLIAFWLYSDGIGTIVKMATVYGREVGIGRTHLIGALLLVQILAAPASLWFGRLAGPLGPQRAVFIGLMGYVGITVLGFFLSTPLHFWLLAVLVALFQGGTQALSRSMFAALVPRAKLGELFGFYSVSEKLAGVLGPLMFGLVAQASGASRYAVLTLMPFFILGGWLLMRVDLAAGARRAEAEGS
ncbi:MAG TPA: MFS transporter [Candidatus Limnocylindria bacterium]|nr:MFS transporter [Candidatus Limnocylindria bacterium]